MINRINTPASFPHVPRPESLQHADKTKDYDAQEQEYAPREATGLVYWILGGVFAGVMLGWLLKRR